MDGKSKDNSQQAHGNTNQLGVMMYKPLPVETRLTLENQHHLLGNTSQISKGEDFLVEYVNARTSSNIEDLSSTLKKHFPLQNIRSLKENKPTRNKKHVLTSFEKRKLGLQKLPKTGLKYKSFASLHQLWVEYMEHLLDLEKSTASANQDMLHQRIAKADYHGCLLMITRSKCPSYIGTKGIVVLETKNTFQIICEDDRLRIIPKRDSVFTFVISRWNFTLFGNHMNIRPSERAARKFKSKPSIDL